MTQKFHIDKNGKPAPCRATKRPCPLGGAEVHFDSIEEAQAHVDTMNAKEYGLLAGVSQNETYVNDGHGNLRVSVNEFIEGGEFRDHLVNEMNKHGGIRDENGNQLSPSESMELLTKYAERTRKEYPEEEGLDYYDYNTGSYMRVQIYDYNETGVDSITANHANGMKADYYSDFNKDDLNELQANFNKYTGEDIPLIKGHEDSLFGVDGKAPFNENGRMAKMLKEAQDKAYKDDLKNGTSNAEKYDKFLWHGARKNLIENPKVAGSNNVYPGKDKSSVVAIYYKS